MNPNTSRAARLPDAAQNLARYRIWDCYGIPPTPRSPADGSIEKSAETMLRDIDRIGIERIAAIFGLGTGGATRDSDWVETQAARCLERRADRLLGILTISSARPERALERLDRWIKDGPMVGIFFLGSREDVPCSHPSCDPIVRRAHELGAVILQHTWFNTLGKESPGDSTPTELVELAGRHPDIPFVCIHTGGEWEKGIRAVRNSPNILVETSGFDPTSGYLEMAVRELGAARIVYGGHYPGRSFGTELSKVLGADVSEADRRLVFGENFRRLLAPILRAKGRSFG